MTTTYYSFDLAENAQKFIGAVIDHGARAEDISVIAMPGVMDDNKDGTDIANSAEKGISTTTPADAAVGAAAGAGIGLATGIAAALAAIFIPGFGLVAGGGALATAIAGAAATTAGGALAGGVAGYLRDMGVEGDVPEDFERDYKGGKVIVGVAYHENGISPESLSEMSRKYHASRTSNELPPVAPTALSADDTMITSSPEGMAVENVAVSNVTSGVTGEESVLARDIMSPSPVCCTAGTVLNEVARMMVEHDCGAIPVCAEGPGKQVIGMITDRDIVARAVAENRNPLLLRAEDCMTSSIACVQDTDSLPEVCRIMEERQVRRIPVVDQNNSVVGIISQADLAQRAPEKMTADVVREISQPKPVML